MKLIFNKDGFVDGQLVFEKGKIYEIDNPSSVARWIARGATLVEDKIEEAPKKEVVIEQVEEPIVQEVEEQTIDTEVKLSKNKSRKKSRGVETPL